MEPHPLQDVLTGANVRMTAAMFSALQKRAMARIGRTPSEEAYNGFACPAPGCGSDSFHAYYLSADKTLVLICAKCRVGRVGIAVADGEPTDFATRKS